MLTDLALSRYQGRTRLRYRDGDFAVRVVEQVADAVRVVLVGRRALLLTGDDVRIRIRVDAGLRLEVGDAAGTTAYDGRDRSPSRWEVSLEVAGSLAMHSLPFVVAHGARVRRETDADLAAGAVLLMRETLILGRAGEIGGAIETRTRVRHDGRPLHAEDLDLNARAREEFGVLGSRRVLDSLLVAGRRVGPGPEEVETYQHEGPGTLWRWQGHELHRSPLESVQVRGLVSP